MLMMMSPKNKSGIADSIIESFSNGKKEHSSTPKEYSESCKMAALELVEAVFSKDANRVISAFIALDIEAEPYMSEEEAE